MAIPIDYRRVLDGLSDAVVVADELSTIVYANRAVSDLLGWMPAALVGRHLTTIMPPRMRAAHDAGFRRYLATRSPRLLGSSIRLSALRKDETEVDVELTLSALDATDGILFVGSLRDLREVVRLERQVLAQQRLVAQHSVMNALLGARTLDEAGPGILEAIAVALGWDAGVFWAVDRRRNVLRAAALWSRSTAGLAAFLQACRESTFAPGEGIPGKVWQTMQPAWLSDLIHDASYVRRNIAGAQGIRTALLFPVASHGESHGVIEFLAKGEEAADEELLQSMATIGFQIGQFLDRMQRADRLRATEGRLATILRSIGDGVIATDEEGRVTFMNPVAESLTAWSAPEAMGRPLDDVFRMVDERECLIENPVSKVLRERRSMTLPNHAILISRDGARYILEDSAAPIIAEDGGFHGVVLCFSDATAKKHAELERAKVLEREQLALRRLQEAERRAVLVAEAVPVIVWSSGPEGEAEFVNQRWTEYTGVPPGTLDPEAWKRIVHPDDLALISERWSRSRATGEPYEAEIRLLRAADQAYRWHLARSLPLVDDSGGIVKWIGSATDIDDQKRAQDNSRFLVEATALLTTSLDYERTLKHLAELAVPRLADWCAVYLVEPGERAPRRLAVTHRDPAKVKWAEELNTRYPMDMTERRGVPEVIRSGAPEIYREIPEELLEKAAKDPEHLRILREVGFRSAMTLPLVARERVLGAIAFVTAESGRRYGEADVAAARELADRAAQAIDNVRLYNEAQEAIRVRDDFLAIASHELKTPLTPLQLHVQSIRRSAHGEGCQLPPDRMAERLDTICRQVARLEKLIDNLLDISRITGGRLSVECEDVDAVAIVRDVNARLSEDLRQSGCDIVIESPEVVVGCWDKLRLDQIVSHLLSNAIKFGRGNPIEIGIDADESRARIRVRDHGPGIALEDQARIFGRFERAVATRHYGGFGLGLWIVRQIVDALGGSISLESELGHGSAFLVDLPRRVPEAALKPVERGIH